MAYTTVNKSSDFFNTKLYTGNGGSSTDSITGINFQPDWVWIKARNNTYNHNLYDSVRGLSSGAILSNSTAAQDSTQRISSFDSDGFTLPATNYTYVNASGTNYVAWNWKAGGTGVSNTDGTITSTVSANQTSGFSVVTYTGTGSAATIGHGIGVAPHQVVVKRLDGAGFQWMVFHKDIGNTYYLNWDDTGAVGGPSNNYWNSTDPTSSVFSVNTDTGMNASGGTYIAYCFADVQGFSKFGSYVGNASASDNAFVYCGFKPAFLITKCTSIAGDRWTLYDNKRDPYNYVYRRLFPDGNIAESLNTGADIDFLSNGFKIRTDAGTSGASQTYIFMAFAEAPLVGNNNVPCTAK